MSVTKSQVLKTEEEEQKLNNMVALWERNVLQVAVGEEEAAKFITKMVCPEILPEQTQCDEEGKE